jgi:hypothetical protein
MLLLVWKQRHAGYMIGLNSRLCDIVSKDTVEVKKPGM